MFNSHKFERTDYAVRLGERWFVVSLCECGEVHAYWVLDREPDAKTPRLKAEELSEEIRSHLLGSMPPEASQELVLVNK